jgi:hypothetical protein
MVQQSHAYFERCHAADFDPEETRSRRRRCWRRWLEHYTAGQPAERLLYAQRRLKALSVDGEVAPLPGMAEGDPTFDSEASPGGEPLPGPNAPPGPLTGDPSASAGGDVPTAEPAVASDTGVRPGDGRSPQTPPGRSPSKHAEDDTKDEDDHDGTDGPVANDQPSAEEDRSPDEGAAASRRPPGSRSIPDPPGDPHSPCAPVCDPKWRACMRQCEHPTTSCTRACEMEHRTCLAGCF